MGPRSDISKRHKNVTEQTVIWMDEGIGVILDKLKEQDRLDNTLIIFLSDQRILEKAHPMSVVIISHLLRDGLLEG